MTEHYIQRSGIDTYVLYDEEASYATAPASFTKNFGILQRFNAAPRRNLTKIRGMMGALPTANTQSTSRDTQYILKGQFEGTATVEFQPTTFDFLKYVMGTVSGSGTAADPYNYPQATAATDSDKKNYLKLPSIALASNYMFGGSGDSVDKMWTYLGGKVNSFRMSGRLNEAISATLEIPYATMGGDTTLEDPVALSSNEPYYFTGVTLEVPSGSEIDNIIQDFELTITNTVEIRHGLGSDIGQAAFCKDRDIVLHITLDAENTTFMDYFMGGATSLSDLTEINEVTLTLTGDTNQELVAHLLRCKIDEPTREMSYPEIIQEGMDVHPEVVYFEEKQSA